jgi:alkane 1-monooxygenase
MSAVKANPWTAVAGAYFPYLLFGCFAMGMLRPGIALALPTVFTLGLVPLLDLMCAENRDVFQKPDFGALQQVLLDAAPIGFVIGYAALVLVTALHLREFSLVEQILATVSAGFIGSVELTAAHELVHKSQGVPKTFGRVGLWNVFYPHFEITHIEGHHVWVGTERDESTAFKGESLYRFVWRTIPASLKLGWRLEARRLHHRGIRLFSWRNRMLQYALGQLVYLSVVGAVGGLPGLLFFFAQAAIGVFMLESVGYISHYGLERAKLPDGRFAPATVAHSWDSYHRFSNYLQFQLQRHADHHTAPGRALELLRPQTEAPRMPAGYPAMIMAAMCPPVWRAVMDRRILDGGRVAVSQEAAGAA